MPESTTPESTTPESTTRTPGRTADERRLRLAVTQTTNREEPGDAAAFAAAGAEIRDLMSTARAAGAELIQFCEATMCFPAKRRLSGDPDTMAEADWSRFAWDALAAETAAVAAHAAALGLWTVLGTQRRSAVPGDRPTTGLTVFGPDGSTTARYDERVLSYTKASFLYASGTDPVTFDVNGIRIGLTCGLEVHFAELYGQYETLEADVVLFSTAGPGDARHAQTFADKARAHGSLHQMWIGFTGPAVTAPVAPSGVVDPSGSWVVRCPAVDRPAVVTTDVVVDDTNPARAWRRSVRSSHPALVRR